MAQAEPENMDVSSMADRARRRGRNSLRIDLQAPGGNGLNIPN